MYTKFTENYMRITNVHGLRQPARGAQCPPLLAVPAEHELAETAMAVLASKHTAWSPPQGWQQKWARVTSTGQTASRGDLG